MKECFVNKMKKIMATSTRISADSVFLGGSLSKISYLFINNG